MYTFTDVRSMRPEGLLKARLDNTVDQWLAVAPYANNAMFESFYQRESQNRWLLNQWHGEFPGKLLTGLTECYRMGDEAHRATLRETGDYIVEKLRRAQAEDGYLGVAPQKERLTGYLANMKDQMWDIWSHYHCIYGLLLWHNETGSRDAWDIAVRAADFICAFFLDEGNVIADAAWEEMNMSAVHAFTILYQLTGSDRYKAMADQFEKVAWESENGPDFVNAALAGKEFYEMKKPRWEGLHGVMAIADFYRITGEEKYLDALSRIWNSIQKTDIHNNGSFSSGEGACGNPYATEGIELCCSIAWTALTVEYLRLTKDSYAADELERGLYNSLLASQHPSGRWWTYDTPVDGVKISNLTTLVGHGRPGSPEMSCCSSNSARGVGMVSDWAVMAEGDRLFVNYYGAGEICTEIAGTALTLRQQTAYPEDGRITVTVEPSAAVSFTLMLRIPCWSADTAVRINGVAVGNATPGTYLPVAREWKPGDTVDIAMDMGLHFWTGDERIQGRTAVYYGPILLAVDDRYNHDASFLGLSFNLTDLLACEPAPDDDYPAPWLRFRVKDTEGRPVYLTDFATAGMTGTTYRSWLDIRGIDYADRDSRSIWCRRVESV